MVQPHGEAFLNKKKELKSQAGFGFLIKSLLYCKFDKQTLILWKTEKANTFTYNNKQHFLWNKLLWIGLLASKKIL